MIDYLGEASDEGDISNDEDWWYGVLHKQEYIVDRWRYSKWGLYEQVEYDYDDTTNAGMYKLHSG